ncbi:MAG: class I SAM-dependent methyltransferase [Planctomycetes bacterium]|nr:class I SAM-dependent methyltransferase [Planctomycetota bacterium]
MSELPAGEPPTDAMSATKIANYRSERGAHAYLDDHRQKLHRRVSDRRERRILRDFLTRIGRTGLLLDLPCGYGRLLELLATAAERVVEADFSGSMLTLARQLHGELASEYLECSALAIPRPDRSFGVAVSVRLNHHLESRAARLAHIAELCRVADTAVVMTFFSAASLKNRLRQLRRLWNGKTPKNALAAAEVRAEFGRRGFAVERMVPLARIGSGHVYVLARRLGSR